MATSTQSLLEEDRPVSPAPSYVSMQSDRSKDDPLNFSKEGPGLLEEDRPVSPAPSNVSMKSDWSKDEPLNFSKEQPGRPQEQRPESSSSTKRSVQSENDPPQFTREKDELKAHLQKKFLTEYKDEQSQCESHSELYKIKGVTNKDDKGTLVKSYNEIFESSWKKKQTTVLMKGEAGVGKTCQTRMLMIDWAKGESNKDIDLIVPFHFSELNSRRNKDQSIEDLLNHFFNIKQQRAPPYDKYEVVLVLDGLEECQLDLDFKNNKELTDIKEQASMDVLLTNLIKGNLLPSARLWIISRPSGVDKIPPEYIQTVTECRETAKRRQQLVSNLKKRFLREYTLVEDTNHPNQKSTEHIIRKDTEEVNDEEKNEQTESKSVTKVNATSEIFKGEKGQSIRTVLTIGEADIGKSFHVQKFIKEWAGKNTESSVFTWLWSWSKAKDDEELLFPLTFSKLNMIKEEKVSLVGLLNHFFEETKECVISNNAHFKVLFILDGLDASELSLDKSDVLTDVREPASVDVVLTNLIKGNLLPSAQLWITSRPSPAKRLPDNSFDRMTEIRERDAKQELKAHLQKRILTEYKDEQSQREIDTELYKIKGVKNKDNKGTLVKSYDEIFESSWEKKETTVLMKGEAGVGKTSQTRMLMIDWAKGKSNKDIDLIVPFHFSELNSRRDEDQSIEDLLNHFFNIKQRRAPPYDKYKVVFVLDGLEECQLHLDFKNNKELTDIKERASMDVLLTNLIKGNLLPSARLWIISQPSGVDKIPPEYIQTVTECRETAKRRQQLVSNLKKRFLRENTLVEDTNHPNQKNTEHIIRKDTEEVNDEEKNEQTEPNSMIKVNATSEIFKDEKGRSIRTVLTIGEVEIGKSFHVQKFIKEWAGKNTESSFFTWWWSNAKDNEELLFPLTFSELNQIKEEEVSLVGLLNHFFEETKECVISNYANFKVLFILDGLEASELSLDKSDVLTDVREPASVDVVLTNLIKGNLLPSAQLWITSRPSPAKWLPANSFDRITEIREKDAKHELKAHLQKRILTEYKDEQRQCESHTELYKIKGVTNKDDKGTLVKSYNEIFESSCEKKETSVLMMGEAGIGKTCQTRMLMIDWAKEKSNKDIDLIVPFHFSELNSRRGESLSMEYLLNHFFNDIKLQRVPPYDKYKVVLVLDGLEECQLHLDFENNEKLTDIKERASMDVLLTNLIKGNLLPSARLWIISQPSGVDKIPPEYIHTVTECREKDAKDILRAHLQRKFLEDYKDEQSQCETDTELYKIKGVTNKDDKGTLVKSYNDIFKSSWKKKQTTVLMKGEAGVGKTSQTRMLMIDWAKGKSNSDIDLIVPFHFSELNSRRDEDQSIEDLLNHFFNDIKLQSVPTYDKYKVVFVLDGLEECQLDLDFENNKELTDKTELASMDVLLTNLIKRNLLPSARLWIISQPSGVDKIPPEYIQRVTECREKDAKDILRAHLQRKFLEDYKDEQSQCETDTELYKIKGVTNKDDKGTLVKSYNEIFKSSRKQKQTTVLMMGEAGVGKTSQTRMLMIDWAKEKSNKDIDLIVPFHFSELNSRKDEVQSIEDLLNHFFNIKQRRAPPYDKYKVVFVLDGLEECQLHLDFENNKKLTDIKERASMDVLLTNLIKGNLLPSARLWIISQPSGVDKIPPEYIQTVTECRGQDIKPKLRAHVQKRILEDCKDEQSQREIDTELYKIKGVTNKDDKGTLVKSYNEIFESSCEKKQTTVLMKGEAGVGKTSQTRMLMIDWAKGKSNNDIDLMVPFHFSELNSRKNKDQSIEDLLNHFFNIKQRRAPPYDKYKVVFVLDGLEECQLHLDFKKHKKLTDIKELASMDVLLTNLIKGNLLPSARLWIISQPSGVDKIPPEYIHTVTECREKDVKPKLREHLQKRILEDYKDEQSQREIDTELYKIKGVTNKDDKGTLVKSYDEIFESSSKQKQTTVLMKGEAGVGKTSQTRMLMIDWAKEKSNKDIDLIVPFHFSELNSRRDEVQSIEDLLNHFFNIKQRRAPPYDKYKVVFVLDGLEECQLHLDFENNKKLTDIKERASMDVLLTNLIKRNLLPSARLWIISQPSGIGKIPREYIQRVTECRDKDVKPKLRAHVQKRILEDYKDEQSQREIDTELYKIKGVTNKDDKGTLVKSYNEIFESSGKQKQTTVLMKGEAGVGKTSQTRMLMIDWAKEKSNKDIDLIVPFHFSELNSRRNEDQSIEDLLNHFFNVKQRRAPTYDKYKVVLVLDGLEECQLHLDFENNKKLTDIKERASMDVLLTNLIKGNLLPSARLWIISQLSGVGKIPPEYIQRVTECRDKDVKPKLREHLEKRILEDYKDEQSQRESHSELYVIKDVTNKDDKGTLVKSYNDIFKSLWEKNETTVIMKGVAGIGKTRQTRMLRIDWAKEKSSKDIDLIVPFHFSELNSRRDEHQSIEDLLNHFFNIKQRRAPPYDNYKVVFVLDGLEECQLHLDFENNKELTDIKKRASMDVLLTNLIKGNLLPSARLWIISRPSGVDKIPPEYIQRVTECRETAKRRQQLVSNLKKRFLRENTLVEDTNHPNQKNTEHIIREDTEVNDEEKNEQTESKSATKVNATSEIFKDEKGRSIRTVLTIGEADIGKSFHVQKFIKEWAGKNTESSVLTSVKNLFWGKAKDDEELLFPLTFSKLNMIKEEKVSLVGLLNHFFKETKECVISNYAHFKVLFVLDGLDASELSLDKSDVLTDVREPASVDVVLTNLIKGNLLPSAQLWITSRPSPAKRLPANSFDRMTEIREKPDVTSQRKLKSQLKEQFARVSEGIDKQKTSALLNDIYTDLYIIEGERGEVNAQHESRQVQEAKFKPMREETPIKYQDIFKPASGEKPIRSVLTIGVAGIGKTFASMKYMLDWAEGTENKNIYFTFPLPFRELNLRKDGELSFEELIHQFFPAMRKSEIKNYDKYKTLIVLDGLDECRLDLNVNECMVWTDVRKVTSVNVLLANLIKGNLLPKAQVWITSRPAASNNIPADKVDRVTEVRGFNDDQKEEYFKKRFSDKDLAEKILSHVKKSRSLYIMCHIPVFCWITAKVLEHLFDLLQTKKEKQEEQEEKMPKTLTDMYIHFLLLQCRQANVKYGEEGTSESSDADSCWNTRNKETVLSLGKLAFEELEKGNLLFTEENLTDCDIDIQKTAVFSGLFTQIIREDCGLFQKKFFCFVHLSIQEFLAAFYVTHTFNNKGENLLTESPASDLYKTAVDKALKSKNGDWDLFVRFLLGLSLETNQNLLQEVLKKTENPKKTNKATVEYIKGKINEDISDADKNLNLFHCLNELNDHSLVEEVKKYLKSETMAFENFSASQWSALTFVLLMSDEKLDVFDLKKYLKSEKVLLGMLPVVKVSKTTLLSWCELTEESCKGLTSSVLTSASSNLTKLDLSHNDLLDSGVVALGDGLKSVHCKLEFLKLSGCQVTEEGCSVLASAIKFNAASPLKHLDLSYNHPGGKGAKLLNDIRDDPKTKLQTVCLDHGGAQRLKPGLKKYGADLKFNESTTGKRLVLCDGNRKVKTVRNVEEKVERPETEGRFKRTQVLCEVGLKGVWYWEVEWKGTVGIAVSYGGVGRKWDSSGGLGCNDISWSLLCSKTGYTARHGKMSERIQLSPCQKIAVFLDWVGGSLSYYSVTSGELSLIHTFHAKFTELLFPGFWFKNGSVTLCEID
ncbi:uncharacterized protein [Trachinotus anak]|uniref:uncharacterized protein isoform X2 n=1 Tax=Trachinotus anak TaxID=443729 RepID=UPI0039F18700